MDGIFFRLINEYLALLILAVAMSVLGAISVPIVNLTQDLPFQRILMMRSNKAVALARRLTMSDKMKRYTAWSALVLGSFLAVPNVVMSQESVLHVSMNHAKILRLDRPVNKVIIGNAEVADVTVADSTTVVLTGKNFGSTNLVLLDADGNAIADERILVSVDEADTVRVFRQTDRVVLSCTPTCEPKSLKQ
jgi:Flp pilus assembly secretin CpaC